MSANPANASELRDLYRELILDHARKPRHFGKPPSVTHSAEGINPLCGDKLHLYVHLDDTSTIDDIGFEGSGCAISMASASLLTETVAGMDTATALDYSASLTAHLTKRMESAPELEFGKLRALEGVREFPSRVKCATLAWHALRAALRSDSRPASTE